MNRDPVYESEDEPEEWALEELSMLRFNFRVAIREGMKPDAVLSLVPRRTKAVWLLVQKSSDTQQRCCTVSRPRTSFRYRSIASLHRID